MQRGNMGTHHPSKEQASSRTNKDGMEYVKHHLPGQKTNIWVRKKTKVTHVIEQVRRRNWTWAGHVSRIRDNRWTLCITTWKPYERKRHRGGPVRWWRDELDDYWKGIIWQRIAQVRQMWKQHPEAFAQPWDIMDDDFNNKLLHIINRKYCGRLRYKIRYNKKIQLHLPRKSWHI